MSIKVEIEIINNNISYDDPLTMNNTIAAKLDEVRGHLLKSKHVVSSGMIHNELGRVLYHVHNGERDGET